MTQAAIVVGQVANGFGCRTERESLFKVGLFTNRFLVIGELVGIGIMPRDLLRAVRRQTSSRPAR